MQTNVDDETATMVACVVNMQKTSIVATQQECLDHLIM